MDNEKVLSFVELTTPQYDLNSFYENEFSNYKLLTVVESCIENCDNLFLWGDTIFNSKPEIFKSQCDWIIEHLSELESLLKYLLFRMVSGELPYSEHYLNLLINLFSSAEYWSAQQIKSLKEKKIENDLFGYFYEVNDHQQRILYFLLHYSNRKELLEHCSRFTLENFGESKFKSDGRYKIPNYPTSKIAYSLNHVFGIMIKQLPQIDQITLLEMITGKSGRDLYNQLNGKNLTPSEKVEIQDRLKDIMSKIKSK